jgi:predicted cupin superfamily sugar epimerase
MINSSDWIKKLDLKPHIEGGYFREYYKSDFILESGSQDGFFPDGRCVSTAIYYLLESTDISSFHRIKSDEIWHFYSGSSLTIHIIDDNNGFYTAHKLGCRPGLDENLSVVVKKGLWFAAGVNEPDTFVLAGCTVSPGFDYRDFEIGEKAMLLKKFPHHSELIEKFTLK